MAIAQITKKTAERFPIGLKFVTPDLEYNEEIVAAVASVSPDVAGGLVLLGSPVIDEDTVSQTVTGGAVGVDYAVNFKVTTSSGNIFEEKILVLVGE